MAIFYEHIKGCGPKNNYTSWIKWSDQNSAPNDSVGVDCKYLPKIIVGSEDYDFGRIITSGATGQSINTHINFESSIYTPQIFFNTYGSIQYKSSSTNKETIWNVKDDQNGLSQLYINAEKVSFDTKGGIYLDGSFNATNKIIADNIGANYLHAGTGTWTNPSNGDIKADNKCEALYFNAISDKRAKSNITPTQFSALTVVKNLPIYTFNYNNKPEDTVIGLVAQEAAEYDLDGFNMVDNLNASGENNDFMQMKESKLVYVLWKAVQELSAEVESLKAQLNNK